MDTDRHNVADAYYLIPATADIPLRLAIEKAARKRGIPALREPRPNPANLSAMARIEEHARQRGVTPAPGATVARNDEAGFLRNLEGIASARVRVA